MARHPSSRPVAATGDVLYAWATPSSHGTTTYETLLLRDGALSCNCPAWVFKRGSERRCRHITLYEDEAQGILEHPDHAWDRRAHHTSSSPTSPASPRSSDPPLAPTRQRRTIRFED